MTDIYAPIKYQELDLAQFLESLASHLRFGRGKELRDENDEGYYGVVEFHTINGGVEVSITMAIQPPRGFPVE